jgi:hypothetical protein
MMDNRWIIDGDSWLIMVIDGDWDTLGIILGIQDSTLQIYKKSVGFRWF